MLLPKVEDVGGAVDYYQWAAVLRSVSAFESYRKVYRDVITPLRVAELLILRRDMPRSLHACMEESYDIFQPFPPLTRRGAASRRRIARGTSLWPHRRDLQQRIARVSDGLPDPAAGAGRRGQPQLFQCRCRSLNLGSDAAGVRVSGLCGWVIMRFHD